MAIKKAQAGITAKKPAVKVTTKPKTISQRLGDINLRDVKNATETALDLSTLGGYGAAKKGIKKLTGMKSGGTVKKAQYGVSTKGNTKGYNPSTSPLPNTVTKGGYEKTLDKVGNTLILRGGDKKELGRAQIGTKQEESMRKDYAAKKQDTESRRTDNLNFLTSRKKTGEKASTLKSGGSVKKAKCGTKMKKAQTGGSLGNIYTGPANTNPGVMKAQADKVKANANLAAYKAKTKVKK